ncbi:MAG: hypothetical protein GX585_03340, partial [Clostridiales bacterium]|nr:hypothetical protein [Clostridiales bacterium]
MKASVNRSTLVLTELILNLFIFAVSAAVCVSLFLKAHDMSRESGRLTEAVYMAQTIAEEWRAAGAVP